MKHIFLNYYVTLYSRLHNRLVRLAKFVLKYHKESLSTKDEDNPLKLIYFELSLNPRIIREPYLN